MKQAETLVAQVTQAELMDEQQLNREVTDSFRPRPWSSRTMKTTPPPVSSASC